MNYSAIYQGENRRVLLVNARTLKVEPIYIVDGRLVQYHGPDTVKLVYCLCSGVNTMYIEISRHAKLPVNIQSYVGKLQGFEENYHTFIVDHHDAMIDAIATPEFLKIKSVFTDLKVLRACNGIVRRIRDETLKADIMELAYIRYTSSEYFNNSALSGYSMVFHHGGEPRAEFYMRSINAHQEKPSLCVGMKEGDYIVVAVRQNGPLAQEYEDLGYSPHYHYKIAQYRYGEIVPLRRNLELKKRVDLLKRITRNVPIQFLMEVMREDLRKPVTENWDHPMRMWMKYAPHAKTHHVDTSYPTTTQLWHLNSIGLIDTSSVISIKVDLDQPVDSVELASVEKGRIVEFKNGRIVSRLGNIPGMGEFVPALGITVALYHDSKDDRLRNSYAKALNHYLNEGAMHRCFDGLIINSLIKYLSFQVPRQQLESKRSEWYEHISQHNFGSIQLSQQELLNAFYQ